MARTQEQRRYDLDSRQLALIKADLMNGVAVDPRELAAFGIRREDVSDPDDDEDDEDDEDFDDDDVEDDDDDLEEDD
jgi:hypothetical protein